MQILTRPSKRSGDLKPSSVPEEWIGKITESETFRSAPMMRALLAYLWKHRGEPIGEYGIAIDALGRSPNFDPKTDSTVRVQIARLRAKLREFYETADESFPLRISIPLGRHELQWTYGPPKRDLLSVFNQVPRPYLASVAAAFLLLSALCAVLLVRNAHLKAALPLAAVPLPHFWQTFLADGKSTLIVVPSPIYFFWPDHGLYARDLTILDFSRWKDSPGVSNLAAKLGPPSLAQTYVGAGEMNNAVRILQFLETRGRRVNLIESRKLATDAVAAQNTVLLGMPRTAAYLDQLVQKLDFYVAGMDANVVSNRHPRAGEKAEYREISYGAERRLVPGIITLLPPRPERSRTLLLMGKSLTPLSTMLLSTDGLNMIEEQWKKNGSLDAWEMIVQSEIYQNDTVQKVWPVAFRAVRADFWH